jgi:hypothetical protein
MALQIPDRQPEPGFYYHYKHDDAKGPYDYAYYIYGVGYHTEDDCQPRDRAMQVYRPLYPEAAVFKAGRAFDLRPLEMFYQPAQWKGREVERFTRITDPAIIELLKARYREMYPAPF